MAGITIDITSNLGDVLRRLEESAGALRKNLSDVLAEVAIAYQQDLRGPGPGLGLTPFDTGNLLLSGNLRRSGLNVTFTNDVKDPNSGAEYAEWAHFSGRPTGGYAEDSGRAFQQRFGEELPALWSQVSEAAMRGDLDAGLRVVQIARSKKELRFFDGGGIFAKGQKNPFEKKRRRRRTRKQGG